MGLFSSFRRRETSAPATPAKAAPASNTVPSGLWRRGDYESIDIGPATAAVRRRGMPLAELPDFVVQFAESCADFAPLESTLAAHAAKHDWDSLQVSSLRQHLPAAIAAGLLVSTQDLLRSASTGLPGESFPSPRLEILGVSTGGDRLPLLERCVRSFAENLRAHGRSATFLVSENSADPETAARCRQAVATWHREYAEAGVRFLFAAEEEKRLFIDRLLEAGACSREVAEFALLDPLASRFSCGANRNALLLHSAGEMLASVDDDVVCRLHAPPATPSAALACFSDTDPYARWLFADRAAGREASAPISADYFAEHEKLLGQPAHACFQTDRIDFARAGDHLVKRLTGSQTSRVRATYTGHVGDPGIPTSAYYLYYDGENRERLIASAAHYQSVFASRSVLTVTPEPTIGDATVCPGMAMAFDGREIVPPFFPILHAEDYAHGATMWQACPGALFGHLPLAIAHEPAEGKPILTPADLRAGPPFVVFEFAHLLRQLVLRHSLPEAAPAPERLRRLGRYLVDLGHLPAPDFHETLREQALLQAANRIAYLSRQLEENPDLPAYWRQDVHLLIEHLQSSVLAPDFDLPLDLQSPHHAPAETRAFIQRGLLLYGQLLVAWPAMIEAAKALRAKGHGLMVPA